MIVHHILKFFLTSEVVCEIRHVFISLIIDSIMCAYFRAHTQGRYAQYLICQLKGKEALLAVVGVWLCGPHSC